jgi:hypothetical protein
MIKTLFLLLLVTPLIGFSQVRLYENFSGASSITPPEGWSSVFLSGVEGQDKWNFDDPYYVSPLASSSGGAFATFASFFYSDDGIAEEVELISPVFSCANDTVVTLMFQEYFYQNSDTGAVQVLLSNDDGNTWSIIYEEDSIESLTIPSTQKIDITELAAKQSVLKLKFKASGNQSIVWIIDDITVTAGEVTPPQIAHSSMVSSCNQGPYEIRANIKHAIGISSSNIIYKVNGNLHEPIAMNTTNDSTYIGFIPEQLGFGSIDYQIRSIDNSINRNVSYDTGDSLLFNSFYFGSEEIPTVVVEFESNDLIYTIINPNDNITWETTQVAGGFGNSDRSIFMNFYDYDSLGQVNYLRTHNIELGQVANILRFDLAYVQHIDENDRLEIRVSTDGGETWGNSIYSKSGSELATASPSMAWFVPNEEQWRNEVVDLTAYGNECIRVSFEATSDFGNNLFLDNILIEEAPIPDYYYLGQNFPNPTYGSTKVEIGMLVAGIGQFNIFNMTGAKMYSERFTAIRGGVFVVDIALQNYPAGMYIYQFVVADKTLLKKMVVLK